MRRLLTLSLLLLCVPAPLPGHARSPHAEPDIQVVLLVTAGGPVIHAVPSAMRGSGWARW